jgi:hypothetical protein
LSEGAPPGQVAKGKAKPEPDAKPDKKDAGHAETKQDALHATVLSIYTMALLVASIYLLTNIWPKTSQELSSNATRTITFYGIGVGVSVGPETMLIIVIILSAILGSCVYSLSGISSNLAAKRFDKSWDGWYVTRPFIAAGLGLIFYFLVRGGVLSLGSSLSNLNIVGVAGLSGLIGLFSQGAYRKLHDVADTFFGTAKKTASDNQPKGKDQQEGQA